MYGSQFCETVRLVSQRIPLPIVHLRRVYQEGQAGESLEAEGRGRWHWHERDDDSELGAVSHGP